MAYVATCTYTKLPRERKHLQLDFSLYFYKIVEEVSYFQQAKLNEEPLNKVFY